MSKTNGNDTAFPVDGEYAGEALLKGTSGLSKREIFAAIAMQGLLANQSTGRFIDPQRVPNMAVQQADALIEELNKEQDERD